MRLGVDIGGTKIATVVLDGAGKERVRRRVEYASRDYSAALDLLDQAIVLQPDFPEAWNRRATVHYAEDRYGLAIADVEETLRREPRQFASLMGLAAMQEEFGRDRQALATYRRVLDIYPALKDAQDAVLKLSDALAGDPA